MTFHGLNEIENDYQNIKCNFQKKNNLLEAYKIADQILMHDKTMRSIFKFLIRSFEGKLRNDKKTPLVFHSIYMTRLMNLCGGEDIDSLLIASLHDLLEDTDVSEEELKQEAFMKNKRDVINSLKILKEDKNLSREPDGINLPPRYLEHISRIIGAKREVINTEILDRFSDLMDLEYILDLPEKERDLRLRAKLLKVKSFVYNIIKNRNDFNKNCLNLFESKVSEIESKYHLKGKIQQVSKAKGEPISF
jgi:(p)ppGpp synthase/HD superfamily hydrolase